MATIGYEISDYSKNNGSRNVKLRLTHNKKSKYFSSGICVRKDDISRSGNIKNKEICSLISELVAEYTRRLSVHTEEIKRCSTVNEVYSIISREDVPKKTAINFLFSAMG